MKFFQRFRKPKTVENPWLDIPHDHDWLEANKGVELVCGLCGKRKDNIKE